MKQLHPGTLPLQNSLSGPSCSSLRDGPLETSDLGFVPGFFLPEPLRSLIRAVTAEVSVAGASLKTGGAGLVDVEPEAAVNGLERFWNCSRSMS